eukprot:1145219-Pelagomonas_calceolata.AAC.9
MWAGGSVRSEVSRGDADDRAVGSILRGGGFAPVVWWVSSVVQGVLLAQSWGWLAAQGVQGSGSQQHAASIQQLAGCCCW